ncbi:MAG TPA: efflux RND transporter permease subunit [Candidatus Krumholzibacteriaceae bacterium]|nr:efflux RND transporter permease subunit [Candidatus Krumholzibacteriaceae bacterium]
MLKIIYKIIRSPKITLAIILLLSAVFFVVMKQNSRMETDLDDYMPQEHPAFVYSNQAEEWFNIQDGVIIAIENDKGVYRSATLQKIKDLTGELQKMAEIDRDDVTSLYTADNITGSDLGLDVEPFFEKVPEREDKLANLRQDVRTNEMIFGRLVNTDETVTVIIAEIKDDLFTQEFYHRLLDLAERYEGPEKLYVAGRPIVEGTMAYLGPRDMKRMVPIVIAVIIIVLLMVQRSFKAGLFTLLVVLFSVVWAFGLMALLNVPIYAVSTMIPVMLIAIGVADGIHLYSHLHIFMKENPGADRKTATRDMIKEMWKPVVMTSVTTAVGFISLLTSEVYPIKYFGLFTAFGVMMAMVFSLSLIPAGLMIFGLPGWKDRGETGRDDENKLLNAIAGLVVKHKYATLFATIAIVALSILGTTKVWINSSFLDKFEADSKIVMTDAFINENFGGTSTLNVILDSESKDAFKRPEILRAVDSLQADVVESLPVVGNSFALTDYLRRMNKVMHADSAQFNIIPSSRELVAQYLLLYEMSGDPENLWEVVDYNYRKANLTFQLKSDNSIALNSAIAEIEEHIPELKKLGVTVNYAGSGYKGLVFTDLILEGQIKSLLLSLIIVIILLSLMFRNIRAGIIGAVPISVTAVISFGVMGLLGIPLSTTTALLSSIAIGIGIDYAVHFIERYRIYAGKTGDKELTGRKTMQHSGRAIAFNAIVVIAGFLVLLASVFPPNRALGGLVSMNMFTSFLGTVTIMYLLLVLFNVYFKKKA